MSETVFRFDITNFTRPNSNISHLEPGTFEFDVDMPGNKTLLVTIGDSWAWGDELPSASRQTQCFGSRLAKMKKSDWLNLSIPGLGNQYIGTLMQELAGMPWLTRYDTIDIVVILTEIGRDFNGWFDRNIDYAEWLRANIRESKDYTRFLAFLNHRVAWHILESYNKIPHARLLVATNFVDPIGLEPLLDFMIEKSWFDLLESDLDHPCYFVSSYILEKLQTVLDLELSLNKYVFDEWACSRADEAIARRARLENSRTMFPACHPTAQSHKIWANYLYQRMS